MTYHLTENKLWSFFDPFKTNEPPKKDTSPKLEDIFPDPTQTPGSANQVIF